MQIEFRKIVAAFIPIQVAVKNYCPMQSNPLVYELEIQDHQDGQDKEGDDETDDPLISIHSPHHVSNDLPAVANVDIDIIQLQCQIRIAQQGLKRNRRFEQNKHLHVGDCQY